MKRASERGGHVMRNRNSQPIHSFAPAGGEFAVAAHQLVAVMNPRAPIRTVLAHKEERFVGRAYFIWRDDPELARQVNEKLSAELT